MNNQQMDVWRFMDKHGQAMLLKPGLVEEKTQKLQTFFIEIEVKELALAIKSEDVAAVADELASLLYSVLETAISFGIDLDRVFDVVHCNRMMKPVGVTNEDGTVVRPDYHISPRDAIAMILERQGPLIGVDPPQKSEPQPVNTWKRFWRFLTRWMNK